MSRRTLATLGAVGALAACASSAEARAQSLEGTGRVTLTGGWRYTPNDYFQGRAAEAGFTASPSAGGPQAVGTFAYAATSSLEVAVDLFAGAERIELAGTKPLSSATYGAMIGFRSFWPLGAEGTVVPNAGLALGPMLAWTTGGPEDVSTERLATVYAASAGVSVRLSETFGLALDVRYLLARGLVPGISGINMGGLWAGVGATWFLPGEPSRRGAVR